MLEHSQTFISQDRRACFSVCLLPCEVCATTYTVSPGDMVSGLILGEWFWGSPSEPQPHQASSVFPLSCLWWVCLVGPGCVSACTARSQAQSAQAGACQPSSAFLKHSLAHNQICIHFLPQTTILWNLMFKSCQSGFVFLVQVWLAC